MNPIDRFTRDDVSAKVWWPFAMLLVVALILTFPAKGNARDEARQEATARGVRMVTDVLAPALGAEPIAGPLASERDAALTSVLADHVLDEDGSVDAIRLWAVDGQLLYSSAAEDVAGSEAAINDEQIQKAADAPQRAFTSGTETSLTGEPADPRIVMYLAIPQLDVVAEVGFRESAVLGPTDTQWFTYQAALLVAAVIVLTLAGLSMREPVARIGAGVAFYPTSVPPGSAVIDADDAALLRQAGAHARRRIAEMQGRMESLELEKIQLEGELQRALSSRAMATPTMETAIPRAAGPTPVADVEVIRPARREPVKPEPVVVPEPVRVAEPEPEPEPEPVRVAEPVPVAARVPTPKSEDGPIEPVLLPETEVIVNTEPSSSPDRWAASAAPQQVVRVPDAEHDDVLSILERLVEPVGGGTRDPDVDPSDLRARLARTAARKKPGSRAAEQFGEDRDSP